MKMNKVIIVLFMMLFSFCLFVSPVFAEETEYDWEYIQTEEDAELIQENIDRLLQMDYVGYCGQYAHDVAWMMGILEYDSEAYNGREWYAGYLDKKNEENMLQDGWDYDLFGGETCLDDILDAYDGTVYNLIISKESASAPKFGHVFFVHAIKDGIVYFSDSFNSELAPAKKVVAVSLEDFKNYYFKDLSQYKKTGIIHFYEKDFYTAITVLNSENKPVIRHIEKSKAFDYILKNGTFKKMIGFQPSIIKSTICKILFITGDAFIHKDFMVPLVN